MYAQSVVDQRSIFHKLKNVRDACQTDLKEEDHREQSRQLLQEASDVYQAESAEQAKERLAAWSSKWGEVAPQSVATLERDFDTTIAFYQLEGIARQWVRSTSLLERVNRQLRRKFRQALSFGSNVGVEATLYLQVQRLHAQWQRKSWWQTSHVLSLDLLQAHHVGIGKAFRPFPPSKRSMRLSPHCAFRTCPSNSFWTLSMQDRSLV